MVNDEELKDVDYIWGRIKGRARKELKTAVYNDNKEQEASRQVSLKSWRRESSRTQLGDRV